jgi:pilus assembly protein Flp/PilA
VRSFAQDACGATAIEYAMIAGLISIAIVTAVSQIGSQLVSFFNALAPVL